MPRNSPSNRDADFARQVNQRRPGLIREFIDFLRFNKKWWLAPIVVVLLLIGVLVILGGTPLGAALYTLF